MTTAARTLAAEVDAIRTRDVPDTVLSRASDLFLDYLGVTLAGAVDVRNASPTE